ncbi:6-carboxytetrahydropterin synthase QueD [Methanosarcina sp. 1.H.A.2.2]|uniref:6-carboxytetrahydropterin synthase QueD n=1 Tax=Methanosarcina sp. 1.H.A.2.2 TaxID=1483601 RepID=UPI0006211CDF|nr:6-carboxytetrahydropterin synthase QueD [Methanosarcina sp. 1.H.A.2.2]KKH50149.1 6-carboxy-5,6,7,8-tetrahydropterin synthase [Methanosarcina sp. 1.H.A.2.2]
MTNMRLGIIDYIDSAHYLPGHGKCGRVHGHTYKIEVVVEGEVRDNGMVIDFYDLKKGIKETLQEYDHTLLNDLIEFPSSEHLCQQIHSRLLERFGFSLLVRVWEGEGKWCEMDNFSD